MRYLLLRRSSHGGPQTARPRLRARSLARATRSHGTPSRTLPRAQSRTLRVCHLRDLVVCCSLTLSSDYLTANDPTLATPLTDAQKADLYAQLASGAESGWDYSSRFLKEPLAGGSANTNPALRTLNIKNIVPVDLNSILCTCSLGAYALHVLNPLSDLV